MRVSFVFPSSGVVTGGNAVLYEAANALGALGHDVFFLHGPKWEERVDDLSALPDLCRQQGVEHRLIDTLDDPRVPEADVVFLPNMPASAGLPAGFVQGYRMLSAEMERDSFLDPGPKMCVATWLQEIGVTEFGADPATLLYTPIGLDHDMWQPVEGFDPERRPIDVALLCHPHREKGWPVAAEMLRLIQARRPDLRLVVFGRVWPDDLPTGVEYVDSPDATRLAAEIYGRAKVFVQTSHHEGFGYTAVESMACGAALVSTDCGGSRDYAFPGETAVVVPPNRPDELADAVIDLLDDEPRRRKLAEAGERRVRAFDWSTTARVLEGHLEDYLADPAKFGV